MALATLSAGEREVLDLLSEGLSPGMMATRLPLSRGTIESRLATAYQKLGAHDRLEATRVYRGLCDIDIDEPVRA
ncbi:MAG: helix-turn-helix transcriptional regulator [Actinobacteria bacterium]|nr:MAG: helix-turn-helix transcriptional regulator [Actinomycetota bacterium]